MQSKKAFVMPWGSCSMLLFCLDSSSPQTKPKLRQVRALASRKWSGSWPRISAPNMLLWVPQDQHQMWEQSHWHKLCLAGLCSLLNAWSRLASLIPGYEATRMGLLSLGSPTHQHNPCLCGVTTHREAVILMAGCDFGDISYTDMTWTFFLKK